MKSKMILQGFLFFALLAGLLGGFPRDSRGDETGNRYGVALSQGYSYNAAEEFGFTMLHGVLDFPYDKIWDNGAPNSLRFRVEPAIGRTFYGPDGRTMASLCVFAHYYLDDWATPAVRPFVEGGIGGIYTDFQMEDQGSRLNFNPQLGVGADVDPGWGRVFFGAVRLHHVSNANLFEENRGLNSLVFLLGTYF